jgi:hypothetical protein
MGVISNAHEKSNDRAGPIIMPGFKRKKIVTCIKFSVKLKGYDLILKIRKHAYPKSQNWLS